MPARDINLLSLSLLQASLTFTLLEITLEAFEWINLRFSLFQALDNLSIKNIYMIEKDNDVVTLCIVAGGMEKIRPLARMRIIDELIARNNPTLYKQYMFLYEVWDEREWMKQTVKKVWIRKKDKEA